ncbi:MAG: transcriptional regulator [Flammeovirgaceae bacterium]|nr:transcriptional regulator [Flammeovirgaceae bacterium]|tara:strand:- start:98 stop:328 length:231 start_codon:yes stop_codon:yes gene_type:complete
MKRLSDEERIKKIASKIKALWNEQGYKNYEDFAVKNSFDRKQMWRVEQGQNLKLTSLFTILNALGVTLSDFFKDIE